MCDTIIKRIHKGEVKMLDFTYYAPTKVYFGKDEELKVGKLVAEYHPHKVLVHYLIDLILDESSPY